MCIRDRITSPFCAQRSDPTTTALTSPLSITWAAAQSGTRDTETPASASSQAVSRDPCRYGRVSVAITAISLPIDLHNCAIATSSPLTLQWVNTRAEFGRMLACLLYTSDAADE